MKSALIFIAAIFATCDAASVLFILPVSTNSHKNVFMPLAKALGARGHQVDFVSSRLSKKPIPNVKEYAVPTMEDAINEGAQTMWMQLGEASLMGNLITMYMLTGIGAHACDMMYQMPEMKPFLNGEKHVDVVIMSIFFEEACLGLIGKLQSPYIYVSTTGNWPHLADAMDFSEITSVTPSILLTYSNRMSFWQRVVNTVQYHGLQLMIKYLAYPAHEKVVRKYLGESVPDVDAIHHNASLAFLNTSPGMDFPSLLPPNVIQVGGMHCAPSNPLPKLDPGKLGMGLGNLVAFCPTLGSCLGFLALETAPKVRKKKTVLSLMAPMMGSITSRITSRVRGP